MPAPPNAVVKRNLSISPISFPLDDHMITRELALIRYQRQIQIKHQTAGKTRNAIEA
jgi:hypothetical protein